MASIPSWVYALLKLLISIGSPYLLALVKDKMKNLPAEVVDLISELIKNIIDPKIDTKEAKRVAARKLEACTGVACQGDIKKD